MRSITYNGKHQCICDGKVLLIVGAPSGCDEYICFAQTLDAIDNNLGEFHCAIRCLMPTALAWDSLFDVFKFCLIE